MTIEEIDDLYRQFWTKRSITEYDLLSFYDILFQSSNVRHYEIWLQKANKMYEEQVNNLEGYQNIKLLLLIGKVESILEKIYES